MSLEHFTMDPRLPVDEIVDLQELWDSDSFVSRHGIDEPSSIEGWPCMNIILAQDEMEDMEFKSVIVLRDRLMTDAAYCPDLQTENAAFTTLTENQLCHSSQQRTCPLQENHHKNRTEDCEIAGISEHTKRHSHNPRENKETSHGPVSVRTLPPLHIKTEPLSQPGSPQSEPGHNVTMTPLLSTTPSMPMELSSHGQANTIMEYPYLPKANVFATINAVTCHYAERDRSSPSVLSESQSSSLFMSKMMDNGSNALPNGSNFVPGVNLANRSNLNDMAFTQLNVKLEPQARGAFLPPTPPSSNTSDCEGGFSPIRDRESGSQLHSVNALSAKGFLLSVSDTLGNVGYHSRHPIISPHISSQPKSGSGTIYLTEEEKRSLIAEGYPVPVKFPLTKVEEKSLKKIRRKIKNKISAQESRRKKKEYLDALERRSDMLAVENMEFRRRVMELESTNASLQNQLRNLEDSLNQLHKMDKNRSTAISMKFNKEFNMIPHRRRAALTLFDRRRESKFDIAEGYPIPVNFPLTIKVEEKSLKKIRRKISAQESRRRKNNILML